MNIYVHSNKKVTKLLKRKNNNNNNEVKIKSNQSSFFSESGQLFLK